MKNIIIFITTIVLLVSCTKKETYTIKNIKGVKTFQNSLIPADDKLKIEPKLLFTINGTSEKNVDSTSFFSFASYIDVDSKGNIFILDGNKASIKKFDNKGNFLKSFGRQGQGPGEFEWSVAMSMLNDTLYVVNGTTKRINKYDLDGNYTNDILSPEGSPDVLQAVGKNNFVGFVNSVEEKDEKLNFTFDLTLFDKKFERLTTLHKGLINLKNPKVNFLDVLVPYAIGDDRIFVANNSEDLYQVSCFDLQGELLYNIQKNYRKTKFTTEEQDMFTTLNTRAGAGAPPIKVPYKKVINGLYYDKYDRLWVASSQERDGKNKDDLIFDIFKDGIFQNTLKFDIAKGNDFYNVDDLYFFKAGKLFLVNGADATIKVYEY